MLSVEEYEKRRELREETGGEYSYNIASLLDASSTVQYQEKQTAMDRASNAFTSLLNGGKGLITNTAKGLLAQQYDNYLHPDEMPEEITDDDADLDSLVRQQMAGRDAMDAIANADILKRKEVRADSAAERYAYSAIEGIGQMAAQYALASIPFVGQVLSPAAMYYQTLGSEYDELREQGVEHDRAFTAAEGSSAVQSPLEYIGFSKLTGRVPANTVGSRALRMFLLDKVGSEVATEGLQRIPQDISQIYAMNPEKSAAEVAQMAWEKKWEIIGNAIYEAAVAAPGAALFGGISMVANRRAITHEIKREMYNEGMAHVEESVNHIKESGVNPQFHAAVVNDNRQNQTVYVDGEALAGYAQEKGAEKVAESLGVSVEDIEKAAADGSTVDVKLGNFEATCAAFDGFFQEVKDGTAFEDGGYTPKKEQAEQEQIKRDRERYAELRDQFKSEEDRIISEFAEAGVGKQLAMGQVELLRRFAENLNPDYALSIMQNYKVRRGENGEVQSGYGQFAGENAETADKVKLAEAQKMESEGKAADEIYKATGWFKGLDNKWRFEIPDDLNAVDLGRVKSLKEVPLARVYYNEALFDAYPELRSVVVRSSADMNEEDIGEADLSTLEINLNENLLDDEEMPSTVLHEVAHIIAKIEGYASGGDSATVRKVLKDRGEYKEEYDNLDDDDLYNRLGGEQEAREVERRANIEKTIADAEKKIEEAKQNGDEKALKRSQFVKNIFERKLNEMPTPHKADAVIVFNGREIPYSKKQDESLAGNILLAENTSIEEFRKLFDETAIHTWHTARVEYSDQKKLLGETLKAISQVVSDIEKATSQNEITAIREKLKTVRENVFWFNKHGSSDNFDAVMVRIAREVFEHHEAVIRSREKVARDFGDFYQSAGDYRNGSETENGPSNDGRSNGDSGNAQVNSAPASYSIGAERDGAENRYHELYKEQIETDKRIKLDEYRPKSRSKESGFFDAMKSLFQAAWHGSPHKFAKFDLGAIGTGEGAQAHGWGLYFAQDKTVAEAYRDELTKQYSPTVDKIYLDGETEPYIKKDIDDPDSLYDWEYMGQEIEWGTDKYWALYEIAREKGDKEKAIQNLKKEIDTSNSNGREETAKLLTSSVQFIENLKDIKYEREQEYEEQNEGSLFQVEIPDTDVMLDEQKTFEEQPEKVQDALYDMTSGGREYHRYKATLEGREYITNQNEEWIDRETGAFVSEDIVSKLDDIAESDYSFVVGAIGAAENISLDLEGKTGREIYRQLSQQLGSPRAASELLNQYGVEGITYDGKQDGRCYVVFDDQAINIIDTYNQKANGQGEIKGKYNPYDNVVTMFKGADASTVIHETWHFFVEQMWNMVQSGNASEQTVKDFETLLSYAGMTMDEWAAADLDGRRKAHEKLAEAGETYIMEGKSPSYELRRVFRNFAKWLKAIYATIQRSENYAELTDDVREVFDRMLAAEDDIAHMERVNGYFSKLPDVITDNMSDETRAKVEDYIEKARGKAVDILTRRSLVNYTKERRKEIKKFKDEIRPMVEDEVSKRPVYACGYDKKDAARFRELRTQQESVGIWTDENFIDRAFPADTNPVENEVAHLAAVVNPKNWTNGLGEVKKDYQRQADEILQPALNALESGAGQGVDIVQNQDGTTGRVSNNAQWYRDFYAANKRKPTKTELREMARQLVSGDVNAPQVEGWMPTTAEETEAMQAEGKRLADIERHIAACDEIKEKLAEVKKNYSETSAAGSEEFLFRAELTAERYGYSSADEMMQDIEKSPTKAEAVRQRINERVQELTMQDERNNYEAMIRESLYNEDEALLIGVEQQLIEEYAAKAKERQETNERKAEERKEQRKVNAEVAAARKQQAKNAARADLAKMNVKEATRTSKFITAERNAAMKCAKLLAQKKFDEALTQKNLQAYWHAMAAESMKIARRQKQNEKFLKRQVGLKREAWLNETHFAAISQLFTRMGIAKPIHKEAAAQSQFENLGAYAAAMEEQFDCVDIAPWILEGSIPISDTNALTLEQNEDVVNAVKNIKAIVKAQKGVNTFNKENTWAETKALMMEKLSELKTIWTPNPNKPTQATAMERFTASMETLDSFLEYLDDATYGWFSQTWGNIIKRASDKEYEYREAYDKADAEALKKWLPDKAAERAANEEVYYDELGNSVTKHTLVKMLINLGNKENSQRLCETVPVGFERSRLWIMPDEFTDRQTAAEQTRQNLIDFLGRVLTKEDVEYAQRKIDAAEMFWGEKNKLEKRVKGFGLKKVEATPVELTINGEAVVLRGGYFPLMRNGETGSHAASAEVADDDPLQGRRIRTYHTNTSATKARTNARYPVNLFPGAETQWIYESIHDLCWRETMNDFRRVLNDQELFAMLKSKIGTARMQVFKEMLEVCADPRNSKSFSEGERMLGAAAAWLRQRTSHAAIMLNFKVIAQNYANALLYGNAIDGYTMADNLRALGTYFLKYHTPGSHKEMVDFVFSKSSFLRERCELPDITVRDIVNEKKEFAWEKAAREIGIKAMAMTDNATAIPNWLTAYNKKLNEGATEQEAIDYADTLVRRVLGSSRITDVASIQRGGDIMKLMTMFQSFFNARYNEFLRMERLTSKQWTQGQKQKAFANVASYVVSKWLGQTMLAMVLALQNPFDVDDEDKWPELIKELKSYSFSMLGPVGQIGNAITGAIAGMHEYTYRMSAVESTIENVNRSIKRIHSDKATTQDKVEGIVNTATLFVGVPAQLNRIFWNGVDILFNKMDPEIGDIMRRRPKKERK